MPERIKKLRDFFGVPHRRDFSSAKTFLYSPVMMWIFFIALAVCIALLIKFSISRIPSVVEEGEIAGRDFKADRNYEIIDKSATDKLKSEAVATVLPVYDFNVSAASALAQRVEKAFDASREQIQSLTQIEGRKKFMEEMRPDSPQFIELKDKFDTNLGITTTPKDFSAVVNEQFSTKSEEILKNIILRELSVPIVADQNTLIKEKEKGFVLRSVKTESGSTTTAEEKTIKDPSNLQTVDAIRQQIKKLAISSAGLRYSKDKEALQSIAAGIVEPNMVFNYAETDKRRTSAEKGVQNVIVKVKSGEMIIRHGARFDAHHIKILNGIREEKMRTTYPLEFLGTIIFVLLSIFIVFYFAERFILRFHPTRRDYILMAVLAFIHILIMRLGFSLVPVFRDALPIDIPVEALMLAIPVASSTMLLRMLLHPEDTFLYLIAVALLTSIFSEVDLQYFTFFIISNIAGIIAISNADKRSTIFKAGAITGLVNVVAVIGIKLLGMTTLTATASISDIIAALVCAFVGGIFSAMLVLIAAPLIESLLGYTTDIKLLELANLNHPLLRELIVRAPGTYHHSHLTGIIAEAAAEAIGANPLLVRVAAYYHDIGKIRKPFYFVENSKNGEDRHAKLSPHMSALIISSHVKEGIEMAKESKLPQSIIDIMVQHHGTRQISYFFDKAKAQQKEGETEKLDVSDFEYEGPKPQTREAAILMLADVSEASVRSLKEKSPSRIEQTVDRVIDDCFKEKQLDECDLTLKDLNEISKAFTHILMGIYHQRIEYQKDQETKDAKREGSVLEKEKASENKDAKSSSTQTGASGPDQNDSE